MKMESQFGKRNRDGKMEVIPEGNFVCIDYPNYQTFECIALHGKRDFVDVMKVKVLDGKRKLAYSGGATDGITRVLIRGRQKEMLLCWGPA